MANAKPCWYKTHWHMSKYKILSKWWPLLSDYDVSMGFCNIAAFCVMFVWLHWFCARSSKGLCKCWYIYITDVCILVLGMVYTRWYRHFQKCLHLHINIIHVRNIYWAIQNSIFKHLKKNEMMNVPTINSACFFPHLTESALKPVSLCIWR